MVDRINSWEDLELDIEDLFNNPDSISGKRFGHAYEPLKAVISEIRHNLEHYQANPKEFSKFILQNPDHKDNLFDWLPYLSGDRVQLLEMKFFDKNDNEILDKSSISNMIKQNDPAQNETYIYMFLNNNKIAELNENSKKLQDNLNPEEKIVYADINPPGLPLKNMSKRIKK